MSAIDVDAYYRRDRRIVLGGLVGISALSWAYMAVLALRMAAMPMAAAPMAAMPMAAAPMAALPMAAAPMAGMPLAGMAMPQWQPWGAVDFALMLLMWAVMMVAMMVPTASPMILTFTSVHRRRQERGDAVVPTAVFLAGYAIVWAAFSLVATLTQWGLHQAALLSPGMVGNSPWLGGALLIGAGAFQWSGLKHACLSKCRTPLGFLLTEWREGPRGALVMGLRHGAFCTGCCWALMALLFVGGVMNLLWVAAVAGFVLAEKIAPQGWPVARLSGVGFVAWGGWLLLHAI